MAVMDEFKNEREIIKSAKFKDKVSYYWTYYKWWVIIPTIVIALISNLIYHKLTDPEVLMDGIMLNVYNHDGDYTTENLANNFMAEKKINTKEYTITLNSSLSYVSESQAAEMDETGMNVSNASQTNYTTMQVLMAQGGAGVLDFIAGPQDSMRELAYKEYFLDLSKVLTKEQYALYEPYFLYMDMGVIEKRQEAYDNMEDTTTIPIPITMSPDDMEKPIPILIDISQCEKIVNAYGYDVGSLAFGFMSNSPNQDITLDFIDYLMQE